MCIEPDFSVTFVSRWGAEYMTTVCIVSGSECRECCECCVVSAACPREQMGALTSQLADSHSIKIFMEMLASAYVCIAQCGIVR